MSLPAYPWETRPTPLTDEEVCAALWEAQGHIGDCAARLKVGSHTLRKFIMNSPRAQLVEREWQDLIIDDAERHLRRAIDSGDDRRVDWAIRYTLNSANAKSRGWSSDDSAAASQAQPVLILPVAQWLDGATFGAPPVPPARQIELARNPDSVSPPDTLPGGLPTDA